MFVYKYTNKTSEEKMAKSPILIVKCIAPFTQTINFFPSFKISAWLSSVLDMRFLDASRISHSFWLSTVTHTDSNDTRSSIILQLTISPSRRPTWRNTYISWYKIVTPCLAFLSFHSSTTHDNYIEFIQHFAHINIAWRYL